MKITRLEIKGFKSFPDKTVLEFKPGVTGIVGPNGCGKSNVFEAIRWVMGEQRVRTLRSRKMQDVIFNGSDTRKPVGMAEVRLVLSSAGGNVPESMSDYDEIMITRRLFRDGESQYEINNIQCRLQDVTDFFLDTGVGKNSYALIEQGRVDMVVASKPEDRRVLIEEAAGINRYKARREAAIKKLEQTQQNLLRLSDVITEVKRQSISLKRQASRADRYRKLSDRLRELEIAFHSHRCSRLTGRHDETKSKLEQSRAVLLEREARFASVHAELESERLKALQAERALKEILEDRHRIDLELTSLRGGIERDRATVAQLTAFAERAEQNLTAFQEKGEQALARLRDLETAKTSDRRELETADTELQTACQAIEDQERNLKEHTELHDRLNEDVFASLQAGAQERNRSESLKKRKSEIRAEFDRIDQESRELAACLEDDRSRKADLARKAEEMTRLRTQSAERKEALVNRRKDVDDAISSLRERVGAHEKELAASRARLESLQEMQKNYSGYEEGVRFLMGDRRSDAENGLIGPLAEMIDVPPEFEKALTAALGDRLGHLVVTSPRHGADAADRLKRAGAGRSTFIPKSPRSVPEPDPGQVPHGLRRLKDVVRFHEGLDGLEEFLLSRYYVVENIQRAVEIWESNGNCVDLVTTEGEVLSRYGEITGGSLKNSRGEVFEKKREISELQDRNARLEEELEALAASFQQEERTRLELSDEIDRLDAELSQLNVANAQLIKDQENLGNQIAVSERRIGILGLEADRLRKEQDALAQSEAESDERASRLAVALGEMQKQKDETALLVKELTASVAEKTAEANELRVKLAQLRERGASLEREYDSAREAAEQVEAERSSFVREMEQKAAEQQRLVNEIAQAQKIESELMATHKAHTGKVEQLERDTVTAADLVKRLEDETATLEKSLKELRETTHTLEMESVRLEQTIAGIVEKIVERYEIDPTTVEPPAEPPEETEISDIKTKLESMGEVNLAAIAESRHIEERLKFLQEQEADLKKAVSSLYATINKINETTRERFRAAFDAINEQFREIFPFLFRGGEARLELTDEEDLLETGVEIMARPPGKRIRNMDLLSGGEKALTAVGLIFSIFLTRPSPFCLLDEVDAPLDDSNILRFNEMLRKLADRTQFLVITHNKRSMETADTLYGVTMEDPGASSVVSVEFVE
jgi:chromosome segregation protein